MDDDLPFEPFFTLDSFEPTSDDIVLAPTSTPTSDDIVLALTSTPTSPSTSKKKTQAKKKTRAKVPRPNFPEKLKNMINEMHQWVVRWNDAGNGFIILNMTAFTSSLRHFFLHNNYTSFQRNLNIYEFTKVRSSSHAAYTHDSFQRNKPVTGMKRKLSAKRSKLSAKRSKLSAKRRK
jgi:hypothetical protein